MTAYGDATRPEDYLKEFRDFIDNNINEIAALNIVATRPKELTRQSLKDLKIILDGKHFNETMLQTAWKEMTNEDIAADIISFIRQRSIGDALISKDDRIHNAIVKTKANHPELSKIQLGWLDRIEAQLLKEVVLNRETFDSDNINSKELGSIRIDVPTIEEQTEILKIIEPLIKKELDVKDITSNMIENIAELKKSILAKAFRGELGTNVSSEENSIELIKKMIGRDKIERKD